MKFDLKSTKYIKQEVFVQEIDLPESPVYYNCGQCRYLAIFPQFTIWDDNNPMGIWEYKFIWLDDYIGTQKIETGFIRVSEFSQIWGFPQHNKKSHDVLVYLVNHTPNLFRDSFNTIFDDVVNKIKTYHIQ